MSYGFENDFYFISDETWILIESTIETKRHAADFSSQKSWFEDILYYQKIIINFEFNQLLLRVLSHKTANGISLHGNMEQELKIEFLWRRKFQNQVL